MWFRTGQGVATMSLATLRSQEAGALDSEHANQNQLFQRAFDTLRQIWPTQASPSSPSDETGWQFDPMTFAIV